jgi:hypothetical protein
MYSFVRLQTILQLMLQQIARADEKMYAMTIESAQVAF